MENEKLERLQRIRENLNWLKKIEPIALKYYFEPDWEKLDPAIRMVKTAQDRDIYNYFRFAVSSEPQWKGGWMWKQKEYIVYDKNSWAILWISAIKNNRKLPNFYVNHFQTNRTKIEEESNHLMQISRCLPLQPFWTLLWWKLVALLTTSKEVIRNLELTYSVNIVWLVIKTLHGKSSQYNRLEDRNIYFLWEHEGWGYNLCELKKWLDKFLRWEIPEKKLKNKTFSISEQLEYWKERWYLPRLKSLKSEWKMPVFNREDYSITKQLSWK